MSDFLNWKAAIKNGGTARIEILVFGGSTVLNGAAACRAIYYLKNLRLFFGPVLKKYSESKK